MKKLTACVPIVAIASILGLSPSVSAVNLLKDPGFEVENPAVWQFNGRSQRVSESGLFHSGNLGAAALNNGSIIQSLIVPAVNQLKFGAYFRLFTEYSANKFDQTNITLGVASANQFQTVGFDPNAVVNSFTYNSDLHVYQTDWILLEGVLDVTGLAGETALININFKNTTDAVSLVAVDDVFVEAVEEPSTSTSVPEPVSVLSLLAVSGFAVAYKRKAKLVTEDR